MLHIEPLFMLSSLPGEYASSLGAAAGGAILALWRRCVALENQRAIEAKLASESSARTYEASLEKRDAEIAFWRAKANTP